jgi:hypothetical protein
MIRASGDEMRLGYSGAGGGSRRGFGGFLRPGRDFVHIIIDNPLKRIILKSLIYYRNTADQ